MKKSLLFASLLSLFLIGCSSTPIVDVSKPAGPSASNDSSSSSDETDLDLASLRDPNNILSKRSIYFDYDKDVVKAEYKDLVAAQDLSDAVFGVISTHAGFICFEKLQFFDG